MIRNIIIVFTILLAILAYQFLPQTKKQKVLTTELIEKNNKEIAITTTENTEIKQKYFKKSNPTLKVKKSLIREEILESLKKDYSFLLKNKNPKARKLFNAIFNNNYKDILKLHEEGIAFKTFTKNKELILKMAAYFTSDFRIIDILLLQNLEVIHTHSTNCFQAALESRNFAFLEYLINEKDYDINYDTNKLSLKLQAFGKKDLELWVDKFGGEYSMYDQEKFVYAISDLNKNTIEKYIDEGFILTDEKLSILFIRAARTSNVEVLSYIKSLYSGLEETIVDAHKNSLLLSTIDSSENSLLLVKWFLENEYDPNYKNKFEENSIGVAVRNKKEEMIIYLIKNNMSPYERINVRGKLLDKENGTFNIKRYDNLYITSQKEGLNKVKKYLEDNYAY